MVSDVRPVSSPVLRSGELIQPPYFAFMQQVTEILQQHECHLLQLEPEFHDKFACTGCGQCCQRPWWISITREYFQQWYDEFDQHPSGLYRQPFTVRQDQNSRQYADIRRKPGTHECLFLMDDRRCFIHATYGEQALNSVCQTFPRYEGWFGAFLGKFMLNNCPEVEILVQAFPRIRYSIGTVTPEKFQHFQKLAHPLGFLQGYLWLGLQLDLLQDSCLTPVQTVRSLGQAIRLNFDLKPTSPSLGKLEALHANLRQQTVISPEPQPAMGNVAMAYDYLHWALSPYESVTGYLSEIQSGWRTLPQLTASEQVLLNNFLRHYLAYRILTMNFFTNQSQLLFYPAYFLLAANLALLQWLAIYYRDREGISLNQEHLLRAGTVVSYRFEHASQLIETVRKMSPAACLEAMENLLIFDFGANP